MTRYKFFSSNQVLAKYKVVDCEHEGDVDSACNEVSKLGGKVVYADWDDRDDNDIAWVYCLIDSDKFKELRSKYGSLWQDAEFMRNNLKRRGYIK